MSKEMKIVLVILAIFTVVSMAIYLIISDIPELKYYIENETENTDYGPSVRAIEDWLVRYKVGDYNQIGDVVYTDTEIRNLAHSIINDKPKVDSELDTSYLIYTGGYKTIQYYWGKYTRVTGKITSTNFEPIEIYLLDNNNCKNFVNGNAFNYDEKMTIDDEFVNVNFRVKESDYWCLVLDNPKKEYFSYTNVDVKLKIENVIPVNTNSEAWKIWKIHKWLQDNINYVSDPKGDEYIALPNETLTLRSGDCEDFGILGSSLYESVGLDAAVVFVDTDGNGFADHLMGIVYYPGNSTEFIDEEQKILSLYGIKSPSGNVKILYFNPTILEGKYQDGIWIVVDPLFIEYKDMVGYIEHEPYDSLYFLDVGN